MAAILTNGVLRSAPPPSFSRCWRRRATRALGSTKARDVPPPMPRIVRPGGRQHRLELATQRQTAKLTLSQLINRLLPQRAPVRHSRRDLGRRGSALIAQFALRLSVARLALAPGSLPHRLTSECAIRPSFVTR